MAKRKETSAPEPTPQKKAKLSKTAPVKKKNFSKPSNIPKKPENWNDFKKQKKELRLKRRQTKNVTNFDVITKSKKLGERLRCKTLKGGPVERNKLINELHSLLKGQDHYSKFVLAHDTSRIVQWLLKYSSDIVKTQISQELIPVTVEMLQSKYGVFCVKRLLKYGNQETRKAIIDKFYKNVVKLTSHVVSAPVFEYAYSTWATPTQKQHLIQEFFGELYRINKEEGIKHMSDIFRKTPEMKSAILTATKSNLTRILNKNLLDSGLVQTVIYQYLTECTAEDQAELISQLIPHIVVISNSKDGARAAMLCIWHGTNKSRKQAMKTIREHLLDLAKHEHGHSTIITLLDASDDTVLLYKIILSEILKNAKELAENEWGRRVLLWLVAPADTTCFHPIFLKELETGRKNSTCKKDPETRRKEIVNHSISTLLDLVSEDPGFWLKNSSLAYEMLAILKAGRELQKVMERISQVIVEETWKGVEDPGLHMVLKKLAKNDKNIEKEDCHFSFALTNSISKDIVKEWVTLNRGCFLLVAIYENGTTATQELLKTKLKKHTQLLESQESTGSKILCKKLKETS